MFLHVISLRACKVNSEITSIGAAATVGIPDPHFGDSGIQDLVAMDLIDHPPVKSRLGKAAAINDL